MTWLCCPTATGVRLRCVVEQGASHPHVGGENIGWVPRGSWDVSLSFGVSVFLYRISRFIPRSSDSLPRLLGLPMIHVRRSFYVPFPKHALHRSP